MRTLALSAALLLAATIGCRSKQTSQTTGATDTTAAAPAPAPVDTAPAVPTFSFDQRKEFAQSVRQQLAATDQRIKELADQAKSRGGAVSDRALANIRAARKTVDRNLKRVDAATAATWDKTKQSVNQSVERLNQSIEGAQPK